VSHSLDQIKANLLAAAGGPALVEGTCFRRKQPFTSANVFTAAGMREVAISGMCEKCFDAIFADDEDEK
jgi:hypothetical protein